MRQLPRAPTISDLENARREHIICSKSGRIIPECESSGNLMLCSEQYLPSLMDEMKSIKMELELWNAKRKKPRRHFLSKYNPSNLISSHEENQSPGCTSSTSQRKRSRRSVYDTASLAKQTASPCAPHIHATSYPQLHGSIIKTLDFQDFTETLMPP